MCLKTSSLIFYVIVIENLHSSGILIVKFVLKIIKLLMSIIKFIAVSTVANFS